MPKSDTSPNRLDYHGTYTCPVCRHGQISALAMMDAFGCHFCNSIFTANLEKQCVRKADSQPPLIWYWNGKNWRGGYQPEVKLGLGYWIGGVSFVLLPSGLVGFAAYLFPPMPGTLISWFPTVWTILTFFAHLTCVIWLLIEYYQFPILPYLRACQRYFNRFSIMN